MPYLKDFGRTQPKILKFPSIDTAKLTWNITLSVSISENNNCALNSLISIQEELLRGINCTQKIKQGIYKYPKDSIHFSLINFQDLSSIEYNNSSDYQNKNIDKIKDIKHVINSITKNQCMIEKIDKDIKCGFVYTGSKDGKDKLNSLAIQAFLSKDLSEYIEKLRDELNDKLKDRNIGAIKIKGYADEKYSALTHRFTINLVRFFRFPNDSEYQYIVDATKRINDISSAGPIFESFTLKNIKLIVSDNWLSNDNYDLKCQIIL